MTARRDLAVVLAFAALSTAPFLNKAWNIDEPCFLAMARHLLADPFHPTGFLYNWHGWTEPMARINPNPPLAPYLIAPALWASGGSPWLTRLMLLPFDLLAAASLYFLAARFLKKPLLPTLIVLAGPAWSINMPMLTAEKWVAAFGLAGLALLVQDSRSRGRLWFSAALLALALLAKLSAAFLLAPAIAWSWTRLAPGRRFRFCAAVIAPAAIATLAGGETRLVGLWHHTLPGTGAGPGPAHALRAFLAFTGGCLLPAAVWPLLGRRPRFAWLALGAAAALLLFMPALDFKPAALADRLTGVLFSCGALLAFWDASRTDDSAEGRAFWRAWLAAAAFLQLFVYWSIVSRFILFLVPPLTFSAAGALERRLSPGRLSRVYAASLAAAFSVSLALGWVDWRYASVQVKAAHDAARLPRAPGARLWFTGHWGLQEYLEAAGAKGLDQDRGGWDEVAAGDLVVVPAVNALMIEPASPPAARTVLAGEAQCSVPLRLISGRRGQAGFYSSASGFLPYSFSREPLDLFAFIEKLRLTPPSH